MKKEEAKDKLKELVEDIGIAMMISSFTNKPLDAIPMETKRVDKEGTIWFLSQGKSQHNLNIIQNKEVQLLYNKPSKMEFLSVFGNAEIVTDEKIITDLYDKESDQWFNGIEDPDLTAVKFDPVEAYFWDKKSNEYIPLYRFGIAAFAGNEKKKNIEKGKLEL